MTKVAQAISLLGGPAKAARALGVSVQAASFWRDGARTFPADLCITVEKLTDGRIRCEELRPDVDWAYLRCSGDGHGASVQEVA
jgi:DNA-binding transcriptional regulator YdaS (Cro superfamily)